MIAPLTHPLLAQQACQRLQQVPIPPGDLPTAADDHRLADDSSESLYYGFDNAPQPEQARLRAYAERAHGIGWDSSAAGRPFAGPGILTMIYANGRGVPRNIDLALRFACEAGGAPAERESRLSHLEHLRTGRGVGAFDLCDDATSGYMQGFCAAKEARFDDVRLVLGLSALTARWTPAERAAVQDLKAAAGKFIAVQSDKEVDQSGTGRAAFVIERRSELKDAFLASLRAFETSALPAFTAADFRRADAELNAVYAKALKAGKSGTVTADGIRATERIWLGYREAWVRFGAVKYPATTANSWRAWLTRERVTMLRALVP
jgi:hypothetical protein